MTATFYAFARFLRRSVLAVLLMALTHAVFGNNLKFRVINVKFRVINVQGEIKHPNGTPLKVGDEIGQYEALKIKSRQYTIIAYHPTHGRLIITPEGRIIQVSNQSQEYGRSIDILPEDHPLAVFQGLEINDQGDTLELQYLVPGSYHHPMTNIPRNTDTEVTLVVYDQACYASLPLEYNPDKGLLMNGARLEQQGIEKLRSRCGPGTKEAPTAVKRYRLSLENNTGIHEVTFLPLVLEDRMLKKELEPICARFSAPRSEEKEAELLKAVAHHLRTYFFCKTHPEVLKQWLAEQGLL